MYIRLSPIVAGGGSGRVRVRVRVVVAGRGDQSENVGLEGTWIVDSDSGYVS